MQNKWRFKEELDHRRSQKINKQWRSCLDWNKPAEDKAINLGTDRLFDTDYV